GGKTVLRRGRGGKKRRASECEASGRSGGRSAQELAAGRIRDRGIGHRILRRSANDFVGDFNSERTVGQQISEIELAQPGRHEGRNFARLLVCGKVARAAQHMELATAWSGTKGFHVRGGDGSILRAGNSENR